MLKATSSGKVAATVATDGVAKPGPTCAAQEITESSASRTRFPADGRLP